MNWIEVTVYTTGEAYDAIADMLTGMGASGVSIIDPDEFRKSIEQLDSPDYIDSGLMKSFGEDVMVKAYFPDSRDEAELVQVIESEIDRIGKFINTGKGTIETALICDEDWANNWKKYYKPFKIAEDIIIKPTWEDYDAQGNEKIIEIDPGMAFGTGTHETTAMCAEILAKHIKEGFSVANIGCGTGILSIIAAKCGAGLVDAVDNDIVAVKVAEDNVKLNGCDSVINIIHGTMDDLPERKYDLIAANIIADVIIGFAGQVPGYLKKNGMFVASGIIRQRQDEVINAYKRAGLECHEIHSKGEWVAMLFRCPGSL